jgi:hypothetical protein
MRFQLSNVDDAGGQIRDGALDERAIYSRWLTILKLTIGVRGTHLSTLERKRAEALQVHETK